MHVGCAQNILRKKNIHHREDVTREGKTPRLKVCLWRHKVHEITMNDNKVLSKHKAESFQIPSSFLFNKGATLVNP